MKKRIGFLLLLGALVTLTLLTSLPILADATVANAVNVCGTAFELGDDAKYVYDAAAPMTCFSYGRRSMGQLSLTGAINQTDVYNGVTAYGTEGGISFSYAYDGAFQTDNAEEWNIVSESGKNVNGIAVGAKIGTGALIIQKSYDGVTYQNATNIVTNFFSTNPTGVENFYTTDGKDILTGTYYRVIVAYKMRKQTAKGFAGLIGNEYETAECVEVYDFYLCINTGVIAIHDMTATALDMPESDIDMETLLRGETLQDGATTTTGFTIDKLGTAYQVSVKKNGGSGTYVRDGQQYTEEGKYTITAITKLGKKVVSTVYIYHGGEDKGYAAYFGSSPLHGKRIYADADVPTYAKTVNLCINAVDDTMPELWGIIRNVETGDVVTVPADKSGRAYVLDVGKYQCDFYNGLDTSGSFYHYSFSFVVSSEESGPRVNYQNLLSATRFEDLQTKHYEVAYQTAGGGYVFVCFALDEYESAKNYAYEIEKRFIETAADGLYYKSMENPNLKVKYFDYVEMTAAINYYAGLNVEINYFNATDEFTYNSYGEEMLESLESMSLRESIKVFASEEDRNKLIDRQPFINNFTFIQAADFDCTKVTAFCKKNGRTYTLAFGKDVSQQLNVSSVYTITEENVYGEKRTNDVYFIGENTTYLDVNVTRNDSTTTKRITNNDVVGGYVSITADSIEIIDAVNELDDNTLIAIKAPDVYSFEIKCLLSELKDLALYKKGKYEIKVIDRMGNYYTILLTLTGRTRYSELPATLMCFTSAYNDVYVNDKTDDEELYLDVTALKEGLKREVVADNYTTESYQTYAVVYAAAKAVYDNVDATQDELTAAANELETAFTQLVPATCRIELENELLLFECTSENLYTTASYRKYKAAYITGNAISKDFSVPTAQVEKAVADLQAAYGALVRRGDKRVLLSELHTAKATDCYAYTPKTAEQLNNAFEKAYAVYQDIDAVQSQVDAAVELLKTYEAQLVPMADFTALRQLVNQIRGIDTSRYSAASIAALKNVYNAAVDVLSNKNRTQYEIDAMVQELTAAKAALVLCGDTSALKKELKAVSALTYYLYDKNDLSGLRISYKKACEMIADGGYSQAELDSMKNELQNQRLALSIDATRQELYGVIKKIEKTDLQVYSAAAAQKIADAYASGAKALYDGNAGYDVVSEKLQKIKTILQQAEADQSETAQVMTYFIDVASATKKQRNK